jgi:hypothetical protein
MSVLRSRRAPRVGGGVGEVRVMRIVTARKVKEVGEEARVRFASYAHHALADLWRGRESRVLERAWAAQGAGGVGVVRGRCAFVSTAMGKSAGRRFDQTSTRGSGKRSPLHPTSTGSGWGGGGDGMPERMHKGFRNLEGVARAR